MNIKLLKNQILILFISIATANVNSQIFNYQTTFTPQELVDNILPGAGLNPTNITYNGSALNATLVQQSALGFTASGFPFSSGAYLRTVGSYIVTSDPDLQDIANGNPTNGAILEFDFVATGNQFSFSYIFASAEYSWYTCSEFNDAFGLFLSGPGINGPYLNGAMNIALVPGTAIPVSINTVNSGTASGLNSDSLCLVADPNWQANSIYFTTQNGDFSNQGYNGSTIPLIAESPIICGATYHVKIAICNVLDQVLNSGLFFQVNSFSTNPNNFALTSPNTTLFENCNQSEILTFSRGACDTINDTLVMYTTFSGLATNGVDFDLLPDSVVLLPGVDSVYWQINPIPDANFEGQEDINIEVMQILSNGDTIYSNGTIYISETSSIVVDGQDSICIGDSTTLVAAGAESYVWSPSSGLNSTNSDTVFASPNVTTQYSVVGTFANGCTNTQIFTVNVNDCSGTGIEEFASQFSVYPNPFQDELIVLSTKGIEIDFIEVLDLAGKVVFSTSESKLQLSNLQKGSYFLKISYLQGSSIIKIVK